MAVDARRIRFRKEPVKQAMKEKGVSQMDLAELIDRGERSIKSAFIEDLILPERLMKITDFLGLSYHEIALTDDVFVPVIRCKNCKFSKAYYHGSESNLGMFTYLCTQGLYGMNADDYCSRAERKVE